MNWSQYIEQDLQWRLAHRQPLPCEPTLERLAAHYRVSTRPVRTALQRLRERGYPFKQARRGRGRSQTRPLPGKAPAAPSPATPIHEPVDYAEVIARDLISRSLGGSEIFVREQAIAGRFNISTIRVREIFHRLAGQGIIQHVPRRGWRLRPLNQKDLDDFAAVRQSLECLAFDQSWEAMQSPEGRSAMRLFLARNAPPGGANQPPRIDNDFHDWIIRASGNRYIIDFFDRSARYYRAIFTWEATDPTAGAEAVRQHRRILEAILGGDREEAKAALVDHLRYQHPVLKRVMQLNRQELGA